MWNSERFHEEEKFEFLEKAYTRATEILERDRIKLDELSDLYGADTIARDEAYVAKREREFAASMSDAERQQLKLATVFEAILHEQGEQSNWFGEAAVTIKTSKLDDIANGVDEIVEFEEDEKSPSYLALAVDATYSTFPDHKLQKIKEEIDRGELAKIKYAVIENTGFRGELNKVPRVVIGVSARTVNQLAELWLSKNTKELAKHPVQIQILEEVLMQCKAFGKYAESKGQLEIARKYENTQAIIEGVMNEKKEKRIVSDSGERDDVFVSLEIALKETIKK
jgi:hypothetical protein